MGRGWHNGRFSRLVSGAFTRELLNLQPTFQGKNKMRWRENGYLLYQRIKYVVIQLFQAILRLPLKFILINAFPSFSECLNELDERRTE